MENEVFTLRTRVTASERSAMFSDRMTGMSYRAIAAKYRRGYSTVSKIIQTVEKGSRLDLAHKSYREGMKKKAIEAVNYGLDAREDPYKCGGLGVQVLRGLGEFEGEKQAPGVAVNLNIPSKWVRFFEDRADPPDEKLVGAGTTCGLEAENDPKTDTL